MAPQPDPRPELVETRRAIEQDAGRLRGRWHEAREEVAEALRRLAWIGQFGTLFKRRRDRDGHLSNGVPPGFYENGVPRRPS